MYGLSREEYREIAAEGLYLARLAAGSTPPKPADPGASRTAERRAAAEKREAEHADDR